MILSKGVFCSFSLSLVYLSYRIIMITAEILSFRIQIYAKSQLPFTLKKCFHSISDNLIALRPAQSFIQVFAFQKHVPDHYGFPYKCIAIQSNPRMQNRQPHCTQFIKAIFVLHFLILATRSWFFCQFFKPQMEK